MLTLPQDAGSYIVASVTVFTCSYLLEASNICSAGSASMGYRMQSEAA